MKIGEFFIQLGVKADLKTVKDFVHAIGDLPIETAGALLAIGAIEYKLTQLAIQAVNTAVGFEHFTAQTGLSAQELQRWQIVAEQANVSTEAVASSVTALERNMAEIRLGRGNISPFQMLGIGVNQDAFHVLSELRERIRGLNQPMAVNLLAQMGIDPSMIQVLSLSNAKFAELAHTVRGMTTEQQDSFLRTKLTLVQFGEQVRYLAFDLIDHLVNGFTMLSSKLHEFPHIGRGVILFLGQMAMVFAPITTAIVGLILLLDDLATYYQGGNSLIGSAMKGFDKSKLGEALKFFSSKNPASHDITDWLKQMAPLTSSIAEGTDKGSKAVINIVINGVGKAEDVAAAVIQEVERYFGQSEQQTNNAGH